MDRHAYLLVNVDPPYSPTVAQAISLHYPLVQYASTVWGDWDVVARLQTTNFAALIKLIDQIRDSNQYIRSTQTLLVRDDQAVIVIDPPANGRWAFVFLRVDTDLTKDVLEVLPRLAPRSPEFARILDLGGTLGRFDIIATVRYRQEGDLRHLVMKQIQSIHGIHESLTVIGIDGMTYVDGTSHA